MDGLQPFVAVFSRTENPMRNLLLVGVILAATTSFASAAAPSEARQFVAGRYDRYRHPGTEYLGRDARLAFTKKLLLLIRVDQARAPNGYARTLDWDPICDCQDPDGIRLKTLDVRVVAPTKAKALVALAWKGGATRRVTLDLAKVDGIWRVADVYTRETPSLVALLQRQH